MVFEGWVAFHGRQRALQLSARPGHSEHQLGLGIDFKSEGGGDPFDGDWQLTAQGKWMKAHAWKYGFVMSYPRGKLDVDLLRLRALAFSLRRSPARRERFTAPG